MGPLIHFTPEEFVMGNKVVYDKMDEQFLLKLDSLRSLCGFALTLNSTYRSKYYNKKIGGSKGSKHMEGIAADIHCTDSAKRAILVKSALRLGLTVGVDKTFVHVDNREGQIMFTY